jgi:hypothetical protein
MHVEANKVRQHFKHGFHGANVHESPLSDFFASVQAVRDAQPKRSALPPTKVALSRFQIWLESHKINLDQHGLALDAVPEGHGVIAKKDIAVCLDLLLLLLLSCCSGIDIGVWCVVGK